MRKYRYIAYARVIIPIHQVQQSNRRPIGPRAVDLLRSYKVLLPTLWMIDNALHILVSIRDGTSKRRIRVDSFAIDNLVSPAPTVL
jgi:hypothetical protein